MRITELTLRLDENDDLSMSDECEAFDNLLRTTLESLERIQSVETLWRQLLIEKQLTFNPQFDALIFKKYRDWHGHARRRLSQLEMQESAGCRPDASNEFRNRMEEIEDKLNLRTRADLAVEARQSLLDAGDT